MTVAGLAGSSPLRGRYDAWLWHVDISMFCIQSWLCRVNTHVLYNNISQLYWTDTLVTDRNKGIRVET